MVPVQPQQVPTTRRCCCPWRGACAFCSVGRLVRGLSLSSPLRGTSFPFPFQDGERPTAGTGSPTHSKESGWGNVWQAPAFTASLFLVGLPWGQVLREVPALQHSGITRRFISQKGRGGGETPRAELSPCPTGGVRAGTVAWILISS